MKNTQIQTENTHRIVKQGIKQNQKKYPENIETDDWKRWYYVHECLPVKIEEDDWRRTAVKIEEKWNE